MSLKYEPASEPLHIFLQVLRLTSSFRCRANLEHMRQPRPTSGHGFQVKAQPFKLFPVREGIGIHNRSHEAGPYEIGFHIEQAGPDRFRAKKQHLPRLLPAKAIIWS